MRHNIVSGRGRGLLKLQQCRASVVVAVLGDVLGVVAFDLADAEVSCRLNFETWPMPSAFCNSDDGSPSRLRFGLCQISRRGRGNGSPRQCNHVAVARRLVL